jgi:RNase H-fold protein (predicted Holliday junction resolvase)
MNRTAPNILALDVGARLLGVAVFQNQRLVFYAVKSIKKPTKADILKHLDTVLERLAISYRIQMIVLRKLVYPQQQNSFAQIVYREVRKFADENNIEFTEFQPLLIRQTICRGDNVTKRNSFAVIMRLYPELSKTFAAKRIWQQMYYAYLFNAIAVGLVGSKLMKAAKNLKLIAKTSEND